MLPDFGQAGILVSRPTFEANDGDWHCHISMADAQIASGIFGNEPFVLHHRINNVEFGRAISKIAHSFTAAILGVGGFSPYLLDIINGKSQLITHFVGCRTGESPVYEYHSIEIGEFTLPNSKVVALVQIRLYSFSGTPVYYAIAGDIEPNALEGVSLKKYSLAIKEPAK